MFSLIIVFFKKCYRCHLSTNLYRTKDILIQGSHGVIKVNKVFNEIMHHKVSLAHTRISPFFFYLQQFFIAKKQLKLEIGKIITLKTMFCQYLSQRNFTLKIMSNSELNAWYFRILQKYVGLTMFQLIHLFEIMLGSKSNKRGQDLNGKLIFEWHVLNNLFKKN
jgi:hypothetical protein